MYIVGINIPYMDHMVHDETKYVGICTIVHPFLLLISTPDGVFTGIEKISSLIDLHRFFTFI